ncbi:MAG TPA: phosphoenolpyruvate synthase [Clostridia bacterium]|nr:phosphoenolpyruvate synthase [Clostridia bacterium]
MSSPYSFSKFDPSHIKEYEKATIGSGDIGGKARGLIFAREVIREKIEDSGVANIGNLSKTTSIIIPESRFISTEVFAQFMEDNHLHTLVAPLSGECSEADYEHIKKAFIKARIPPGLMQDLEKLVVELDFPLAVRSSSRLEDSVRYSFAGKYLTSFIPNRGSIQERVKQLETAIKQIYASTYGPSAVEYRRKHRLFEEEMAVIVQRFIGKERGSYFYPEISGVGFSKNYRRWTERIKKEDGIIRLVFGIGTRCTGRGYARTFSPTNLKLRPEGNNPWEIARYSQETVDLFNLKTGELESFNINLKPEIAVHHPNFRRFAQLYDAGENALLSVFDISRFLEGEYLGSRIKCIFTFQDLDSFFPEIFETVDFMFKALEDAMGTSVDIEFTFETLDRSFALVQCRPLSSQEEYRRVVLPKFIPEESIILKGDRMLTNGAIEHVRHLVFVDHERYRDEVDKYAVAREVGVVNKQLEGTRYILVGPGRWGSNDPLSGVPVQYSEISNCGVLVEVGIGQEDFVPELSYGTHFFADLDLHGILYLPVFDTIKTNTFNVKWFQNVPCRYGNHPAVRVYDGNFSVFLDGESMVGVVIDNEIITGK